MKILIDIRPLMDEKYSGVSEYVIRLLSALFEIDKTNQYILFCNALHDVAKRLPKFDQPNVKLVVTHIPNKVFNYLYLWPFARPLFDKLVKEKIDIFFMPHLQFAAVSSDVKSVLTIHDLSFLINKHWFSWRKNVWHWFINVKELTHRFDQIVAVSNNTKQDLIDICKIEPSKITVIHSGIDNSFKPIHEADTQLQAVKTKYNLSSPFILFLATLEPRKNIEGLVKAFEILKASGRYQDLKLVLAGARGWKSEPIVERINQSSFKPDIVELDYVDSADRPYIYNLASVFAYPSFYEGFGFPPLEAMACGLPVVASASSSLLEIVGDAGILVDPYNADSIANALDTILSDTSLAANLALRGQERARQFSWNQSAQDYLKLFGEIVK
ncbi:MAG: glycosyltransferase family 1 protein [Candidatus Falkowbacteria bacterium]|nr:glycosyltransferase family 1 protein [Candidatus Falkowbacteria bacterium]